MQWEHAGFTNHVIIYVKYDSYAYENKKNVLSVWEYSCIYRK